CAHCILHSFPTRRSSDLVGSGDDAATPAVVEERVHRLLQHPLLVADDDLGRLEVHEALQTVVPVDHAAIEVVEVGGREATTIQRLEEHTSELQSLAYLVC